MRKITLRCGESSINTTCKGVSMHIHNKLVVHQLSKAGQGWYDSLPENKPPVWVTTSTKTEKLDYITSRDI